MPESLNLVDAHARELGAASGPEVGGLVDLSDHVGVTDSPEGGG